MSHDPWALLREARNSVALEVAAVAAFRVSDADKRVLDLLKRIDAALAVHDAVPPSEEKVEWISYGDWCEKSSNKFDGFQLTVRAHALPGGPWHWEAPRCSGYAATKDEAKSAAIAAARGLK